MARVLLFAFIIGITIYALLDWGFYSKQGTPGGLNRWFWLVVIIVLPILGPLVWVLLRIVGGAAALEEPRRPVAPDDDPEYLAYLSKKMERRGNQDNKKN